MDTLKPIFRPKEIPFSEMLEKANPEVRERLWNLMNEEGTTHIVLFESLDLQLAADNQLPPAKFIAIGPDRTFYLDDFKRLIGGLETYLPWREGDVPSRFTLPTFYATKVSAVGILKPDPAPESPELVLPSRKPYPVIECRHERRAELKTYLQKFERYINAVAVLVQIGNDSYPLAIMYDDEIHTPPRPTIYVVGMVTDKLLRGLRYDPCKRRNWSLAGYTSPETRPMREYHPFGHFFEMVVSNSTEKKVRAKIIISVCETKAE